MSDDFTTLRSKGLRYTRPTAIWNYLLLLNWCDVIFPIIFFGTRLGKDRRKRCFSGDLSCNFSTIPLTIAADSPLDFNFLVKLVWRDENKVLLVIGNLTDSGHKWFSRFCISILIKHKLNQFNQEWLSRWKSTSAYG